MKKLVYLLSIILVTTLMFSCEKDESVTPDIVDEGLITLAELDGQWYFDYYEYDGIQFDCGSGSIITEEYDGIDDDFVNWKFDVDNMIPTKIGACGDSYPWSYDDFSKSNNTIKIFEYTFTIISYNNGILKLKLIETPFSFDYLGGIMVLTK